MKSDNLKNINPPEEAGKVHDWMLSPWGLVASTENGVWVRRDGDWRQVTLANADDELPVPCKVHESRLLGGGE